jgi:hypothetical protein
VKPALQDTMNAIPCPGIVAPAFPSSLGAQLADTASSHLDVEIGIVQPAQEEKTHG